MNARKHARAAGAMAHLLLVVVLALGVFAMHTVGHPDDSSGGGTGMSAGAHASAASGSHGAAPEPEHDAMAAAHSSPALGAVTAEHGSAADKHDSGMTMDMASLCVAVLLSAWALAALLYAAFTRRPSWLADLLAQAVVLLRPNPPPRGPELSQLSVLRI